MKNQGFTLVELITTFALSSVIIILLINVVLLIKNVYSKSVIKTELLIKQAELSNALNEEFEKKVYKSFTGSGYDDYYEIYFVDKNDASQEPHSVSLQITSGTIKFGSYVYKASKGSKINIDEVKIYEEGDFFILEIPITNELYPNMDFGINLVYQKSLT